VSWQQSTAPWETTAGLAAKLFNTTTKAKPNAKPKTDTRSSRVSGTAPSQKNIPTPSLKMIIKDIKHFCTGETHC
jgi:hypothetical protein